MTFIKYPKTQQFRQIIQQVKTQHDFQGKDENGEAVFRNTTPYPVLKFEASVKIHGTNAGLVFRADGSIQYQSRERILSVTSDNAGFMQSMLGKDLNFIRDMYNFDETLAVYGEWCGSSIQRGVALSQMDKKIFVIFAVVADGVNYHVHPDLQDQTQGIFNIYNFPTWEVEIDFNDPIASQNKIVELTNLVEEQCPVGKYFGHDGIGEGVVLRCVSDPGLFFKSKGEKHSVSKVKTLAAVDPEKQKSITDFIEYAVTENRLNQGLENFTLENKNIGPFIKWVLDDIISEELDVLTASQIEVKQISKYVSEKARRFFFEKQNESVLS